MTERKLRKKAKAEGEEEEKDKEIISIHKPQAFGNGLDNKQAIDWMKYPELRLLSLIDSSLNQMTLSLSFTIEKRLKTKKFG